MQAKDIKPIATGFGSCIASDLIMVEGQSIGSMYRDDPINEIDSGWLFLAGSESQGYLDNPDNLSLYDVNTVANYDPAIIPFLGAPKRSAFERVAGSNKFVEVHYQSED